MVNDPHGIPAGLFFLAGFNIGLNHHIYINMYLHVHC